MSDWSFNDDTAATRDALNLSAQCIEEDAAGIRERGLGTTWQAESVAQAAAMSGVACAMRRAAREYHYGVPLGPASEPAALSSTPPAASAAGV